MEVSGQLLTPAFLPPSEQPTVLSGQGVGCAQSRSGRCAEEKKSLASAGNLTPEIQAVDIQTELPRLLDMYIHIWAYLSHTTLYRPTINMESWWNELIEKPKYSEKSCLSATLFTTNPI
jgi:hypothetical protein